MVLQLSMRTVEKYTEIWEKQKQRSIRVFCWGGFVSSREFSNKPTSREREIVYSCVEINHFSSSVYSHLALYFFIILNLVFLSSIHVVLAVQANKRLVLTAVVNVSFSVACLYVPDFSKGTR